MYAGMLELPAQENEHAGLDPQSAIATAAKRIEATYYWPYQSHGSIGPSCAVADVSGSRATIWSATQGVYELRGAIAELLNLPDDAVQVNYIEGAGCYGHNGADDAAADAALISREIGKPVRVQWMRSDEHVWDPKGPAMVMRVRAGLSADGKIAGLTYDVWTPSHSTRPSNHAQNLLAYQLWHYVKPLAGPGIGGDRNALTNYVIPRQRISVHWVPSVLRQSALRSLGGAANTFANESFMDELALAAAADPIEFRLRHLSDERARDVIEAVARLAHWQPGKARGRTAQGAAGGRGVAFAQYENHGAYVAAVADCEITSNQAIRVRDIYVAHDCGLIVNPNGLRNQIEGNAIQAASRALLEEVRLQGDRVISVDWASYPILRFGDVPSVNVTLLERSATKPVGAGEATTVVIAPAIANAVFAATGKRLRRVPLAAALTA
jgi:CO/xanthine dehydrogenase Mo-binding subunit